MRPCACTTSSHLAPHVTACEARLCVLCFQWSLSSGTLTALYLEQVVQIKPELCRVFVCVKYHVVQHLNKEEALYCILYFIDISMLEKFNILGTTAINLLAELDDGINYTYSSVQ